jgi:hypothetical protein
VKPGARVLVKGYARVFNAATDQWDGVAFSRTDPGDKLTKRSRGKLNRVGGDVE